VTPTSSRVIRYLQDGHPDLTPFKTGLFAVDVLKHQRMLDNVGRWVMYKSSHNRGTISLLPHKIVHLQKDYRGKVVYRVENQANPFGRPADPDDIRFVTVEQASQIWQANVQLVLGRDEPFDPDFDTDHDPA